MWRFVAYKIRYLFEYVHNHLISDLDLFHIFSRPFFALELPSEFVVLVLVIMGCRGFLLGIQIFADDVSPQPLDRFTLSQILWSSLGPNIWRGMVIGPSDHSCQAPKFLRTLQLLNCQMDSVHFKFYGTALAHRCETIWSLAHQACLSIPVRHTILAHDVTPEVLDRLTASQVLWNCFGPQVSGDLHS